MLSTEKQNDFKERLLKMRKDTEAAIESGGETNPNEATGDVADYDNHPADMGTEQFEQQRDAGLNMVREERLQEIDAALERIENGTYGLSEKSGKPIPEERLEAEPTARYRVDEA
ncbi:hypothetical protein [Lentibacillus sp. CBA3610]|uniref:hypothetical protein n=1 Tax=Lentibacillus sp. CBA3610 TaxID=2518176 RepID=UPI0015956938|nr:hypothetical protein [Lentibacillus sp. CBA3610]QKY69765.1 hypothetical protein Len3610_09305 [Lentibacillus sp. CBA3610]